MEKTDFLVVQIENGGLAIFPGHADHEADERFARFTKHTILKRCATNEEAQTEIAAIVERNLNKPPTASR
jgi:hypothetical protein